MAAFSNISDKSVEKAAEARTTLFTALVSPLVMFRNLRTGRKLLILCCTFIVALCATTYSLVAEKLIAIELARKELIGSQYLASVRCVYEAILVGPDDQGSTEWSATHLGEILRELQNAEVQAGDSLQTAELAQEGAPA